MCLRQTNYALCKVFENLSQGFPGLDDFFQPNIFLFHQTFIINSFIFELLLSKSMDWFLYDRDLHHEIVKRYFKIFSLLHSSHAIY